MRKHNGKQLYGIQKILTTLKMGMNKDIGINDMRLTSPILSGKLTTKPEERLSAENVETIFEIQKKCPKSVVFSLMIHFLIQLT